MSLDARHHFLIVSARIWALAVALRRCPCGALGERFAAVGLEATLPAFHTAMGVLKTDGLWRLELGPPCRETIEEHEAMLLALFAAGGEPAALHRTAQLLVGDAPSLALLTRAVRRVATDVGGAPALRDEA